MRKRITAISMLVGLSIIGSMLLLAGLGNVYMVLSSSNSKMLAMAFALQIILMALFALRWKTFISSIGRRSRSVNVIMASLVGFFMNALTPGAKAGGEPVRAYLLSRLERISVSRCFATIVAERLYDVSAYMIVMLAGLIWIYRTAELSLMENMLLWSGAALILFLMWVTLNISVNKKKSKHLVRGMLKILRNVKPLASKVKEWNEKIDEAIDDYSSTFKDAMVSNLLSGVTLSMLMRILEITRIFLVAKALGVDVGLAEILGIYVVVMIAYLMPSPPAGLGVIDVVYVLGFRLLGTDTATAAAIMVVDRFFSTFMPAILGMMTTYYTGFRRLNHTTY